jgi:preprotein translocase subunit YajC
VSAELKGAIWRLAVFVTVCLCFVFVMFAVFGQLRFQPKRVYNAEFTNVSGLQEGQFVRIAGVEVGKVTKIQVRPDTTVVVSFGADDSVVLTQATWRWKKDPAAPRTSTPATPSPWQIPRPRWISTPSSAASAPYSGPWTPTKSTP